MSRKYGIKDILLEAGTDDFTEMTNAEWQPSEAHVEFMKKLYKKKAPHNFTAASKPVKGLSAVAAVAIVVCLALAIKPVREPLFAFFGSMFEKNTNTPEITKPSDDTEKSVIPPVAETETEAEIETKAETDVETRAENTSESPFDIPETDEEWIMYLIKSMGKNGYSKEKWEKLLSYGDLTFEYLYKQYTTGVESTLKGIERAYISAYFAEMVKDEAAKIQTNIPAMRNIIFPDKYNVNENGKNWLKEFLSKAEKYAKTASAEYVGVNSPNIKKLLDLMGYAEEDYFFDYKSKDIIKSIKQLAALTQGETLLTKFNTVLNSACTNENVYVMLEAAASESDDLFGDNRGKALALIGFMYFCKAQNEMKTLVGYKTEEYHSYTNSSGSLSPLDCYCIYTEKDLAASIPTKYLKDVSAVIKEQGLTEQIVSDDYPLTYALLKVNLFDGYGAPQNETEKKAAELLKELENLYNAVKYGITDEDGVAERYETKEDINKMSAELLSKVRKYYPEGYYQYYEASYQPFHSQKEGFETLDDWYEYYSKILPSDVVKNFLSCENRYFFTADGKVYTTVFMSVGAMNIDCRTARAAEEKNGVTVISFKLSDNYVEHKEYTINVKEDGGTMRIVGGSFIGELMSFPRYGDAKEFINAAILSISPTNRVKISKTFYNTKESELPEGFAKKLTEYYGNTKRYTVYRVFAESDGSVINSTDRYKKYASEFFSISFLDEYFKNNRFFIEADGTLYVFENDVNYIEAEEIYGVKRLSDTKYIIEMKITRVDLLTDIPEWKCTAEVEIINGSPVITGGTFLSDVLLGSFKN